jgi:hypothetical protein
MEGNAYFVGESNIAYTYKQMILKSLDVDDYRKKG